MTRFLAIALFCMIFCGARGLAQSTPSPGPAAPDPCATAVPDLPDDIRTAFAYDLASPRLLNLLTQVKLASASQQHQIFDRAVAAGSSPAQRDLETAEDTICPNLDEIYTLTRSLALVANEWTLDELHDDDRFRTFANVMGDAVRAVSIGERLTPEQRRTALLLFADVPATAEAVPTPTPMPAARRSSLASHLSCIEPNHPASTLTAVAPEYPPLAGASAIGGNVNVLVTISPTGDVRSSRVYSHTLGQKPGVEQMLQAAVVAAAASTYAPATLNCAPVPGSYIFSVEFNARR